MKSVSLYFLSFILLVLSPQISIAQATIKVSVKKVSVDGKLYYFHKIKKGQTLYAIAKAYDVPVNDIAFENPGVFDGLKVGQELRIPIKEIDEGKYIKHLVVKGETIYSICKQYGITQTELEQLNPAVKNGLQADTYIKIPKKESALSYHQFQTGDTKPIINKDTTRFIYHTVKAKETLYRLSKKYDIPIDRILKNNPEVAQNGLKNGQILKIPKKQKPVIAPGQIVRSSADSLVTHFDSLASILDTVFSSCNTSGYTHSNLNVLLVLPFHKNYFKVPTNYDFDDVSNYRTFSFIEFYEGILLAVDTLRKRGMNINLKVADSDDSLTVKSYLDKGWKPDLFIGSSNTKVFNFVYRWRNENLSFIDPFKTKRQINSNRFFKVLPSFKIQMNSLKAFALSLDSVNLIIPESEFSADRLMEDSLFKEIYNASEIKDKSYLVKKVNYKKSGMKEIENGLSVGRKNFIFLLSTDEPEVNKFLSKLRLLTEDYDISVIGHPLWRNFQLDNAFLHRLQSYLVSPNFVDYESDTTYQFMSEFKKYFDKAPTKFGFWGYDVAWYFFNAVGYFGTDFSHCLPSFHPFLLESSFRFEQDENGNYQNQGVFVIRYTNDFKRMPIQP
ncbi:MAG: LysM peptidoglycan-binding domain-containing protein [Bacteroidales bacterium]|nr:LysM peptidoglycan-binding domain-containing protein [Bacteroidales bacterium]